MRHVSSAARILVCALFIVIGAARAETTFNKDIAPILFKNCAGCHHPGEVAPFSLLNYSDAKKRAQQLVKVTHDRYMPPWKPAPGFGDFKDPRNLSDSQIALLKQWADGGMIEGKSSDLPPTPKFTSEWQLGKPDLVLEMSEPYTVAAEGNDIYRCFVLPMNNTEEKYVSAVEYRPGNRSVVHHALLFLDSEGRARKKDAADPGPGYKSGGGPGFVPSGGLGGWAPGLSPQFYPEGVAAVVKKNSDLVLQMHFHPSGKVETEKSSVAIYFAKKTPTRVLVGSGLAGVTINMPAGAKNYKVASNAVLPVDTEWVSITPHAHLLCREIKAEYTLPGGTSKKPLIWIKDWDFDWQDQYQFKTPLKLPKGTRIDMEFTYDNSTDNIHNPSNPPQPVHLGEQTTDEMALLFMNAAVKTQEEGMQLAQYMFRQSVVSNIEDQIEKIKKMSPKEQEDAIRDALRNFRKGGGGGN